MYHEQHWTLDKIRQRLELIAPMVYEKISPLPSFRYKELDSPLSSPPTHPDFDDSGWAQIHPYQYWGTWMCDFVMRTTFSVPPGWAKTAKIALYLPLGDSGDFSHPEALAYIDGAPYAACDRHHQEILLRPEWADSQTHSLVLHGWTGIGGMEHGDFLTKLYFRQPALVQIHQPTRDFIVLVGVARETTEKLGENDPTRHKLLNALNDAFNTLETRDPLGADFYASIEPAMAVLEEGIKVSGAPIDVIIHATGHAHIDVAWLWTLGETRRKAERTFFNVLRYMEQFPNYHFSQSQPQLYEFIREDQPDLFAAIRQRVAERRWEPMGGMWVEADCNLSGAESLARQFLLGRNYFRQYFGKDAETPVLWLPDVFGYAWALPQLIKQAGLKYFMTIKIGWSQYNRLPYDTFLWQGLDGTQILTHFSTVMALGSPYFSTYNSMANPSEALGAWQNFQQKELHRDLLMSYGYGDGGGGPTREMLENIARMGDMPGLPQVKQSSVRGFFETIEPLTEDRKMPLWNGELYLEYHRGTYTTQARNKRANRKSEFLLHDAEFLAAFAAQAVQDYRYPVETFTTAWKTVCLNQFHDIIPGSSIGPVYEESLVQYAKLTEAVTHERDEALAAFAKTMDGDLLLVNPAPFSRADPVFIPIEFVQSSSLHGSNLNNAGMTGQLVGGGVLIDPGELPAYSVTSVFYNALGDTHNLPLIANHQLPIPNNPSLENEYLKVDFSPTGDIIRIFDKHNSRDVLSAGGIGNQLQAFEDRPKDFDAWDIDIYYDDKVFFAEPASSIELVEAGPFRWTMEVKRKILGSAVTQRISLQHNSPRLDFDTIIDWNERHTMLKVAFPVDILAPAATYEIQWGNVQRPTHRNTSWDWARFESCAHKWVDLSEGDYGISLLNDCKYGHDVHDNVMRLTLLRSPTLPDPMADFGNHRFIYSLLPHSGSWQEETQREAYALNDPVIAYPLSRNDQNYGPKQLTLLTCSASNVIIETIKRAEDGNGIILRLYESHRKRGKISIRFAFTIEKAWTTNLLEENESILDVENDAVAFNIQPYQILTIRVEGKSK